MIQNCVVTCRSCGTKFQFQVNLDDFNSWQNGELIQNAMPYLNKEQRELLISQTCDPCWNAVFDNIEDYDVSL